MSPTPPDDALPDAAGQVPDSSCAEAGLGTTLESSGDYVFVGCMGWRFTQLVTLTQTASKFAAAVQIRKETVHVDGKSLVDLLSLGVNFGDKLTIYTSGHDAQEALLSVAALPFFAPIV